MSIKTQQSAEVRRQTVNTRVGWILQELNEELQDFGRGEERATLLTARQVLNVLTGELTQETAAAAADSMRRVSALWPQSHAYDGAVEYLDSLTRMAA